MTNALTVDQIVRIHQSLCNAPIRDWGSLEGIMAAPFAGTFDVEFYPSLIAKAAKYLEGFAAKQVFGDGNKRVAWLSAHSFLRVNGLTLVWIPDKEIEQTVLMVGAGLMTLQELGLWLNDRVFED